MAENNVASLDGLFKDQFHDEVVDLKPDHVLLQKNDFISWVPSDKQNGEFYSVPTLLRSNQGVSYLGEGGAATTLKSAKAGLMKEAQVYGSELNVRGQLSYKALSQAASKGPKAFEKSSAWLVEDLAQVAHTRLEIAALYGRSGIGTVESSTAVVASDTADVVITEATWAPGMWVLLEGATLEAFTGTSANSTAAITVTSVNTATRTIRVDHANNAVATEVTAGDELYFEGAYSGGTTWSEMCGLYKQFSDSSSTLFGIDRSAYSLVQGNLVSSFGAISKAKLVDAAMRAVDKGCMSNLTCLVGTKSWAALAAEDMALRVFDSSYSEGKSKSGSKELEFHSVNGAIKVICHPFVKQGHAFIFNPDDVIFVGSSKPTFEIPGMPERFFRLLQDSNAVELQNYADMAIYALKPSQTVMVTGITFS